MDQGHLWKGDRGVADEVINVLSPQVCWRLKCM